MADRRTVKEFAAEVEHITGVRIRIRWIPFGLFLEDTETGRYYSLGLASKNTVLTAAEQASACRALGREHWLDLLGLDTPYERGED